MPDDPSILPSALAAGLPALAAVIAAVIAAVAARGTRKHEAEAQRIRDLEARIATKKHDVYEPMIDLFRRVFDSSKGGKKLPDQEFRSLTSKFMAWVAIYGSDEAVKVFSRWMQAAFHSAPPTIQLRLYADFVLAARRDMGYPDTEITTADYLAMRINDLYDGDQDLYMSLQRPLEEVAQGEGWDIPWAVAEGERSAEE